jgi:malonate transporter
MISTLLILIPIFALILAGYLGRHRGVLGIHATSEINRFVVWLALPAVLFDIMANTSWHALYQPGFFAVFFAANFLVFGLVLCLQLYARKHLVDASIEAIASAYPNVGFIGFPLLLVIFGKSSLMPTTIATIIVVCLMFATAVTLIEIGLQTERHPRKIFIKVLSSVFRNPLIIAPILGLLCSASGVVIPASVEQFLKMMGAAATPCALVCVGMFLADQAIRAETKKGVSLIPAHSHRKELFMLLAAKLGLQPALTGVFAWFVIPLSSDLRHMAILLAALPTGTGPFMLAEFYRRDGAVVSRVILMSTLASIATLVVLMSFMGIAPS